MSDEEVEVDPLGPVVSQMVRMLDPTPWEDAENGDVIAGFIAHILPGNYTNSGEFILKLSIPREVFSPHDLMASTGFLTYWEVRKI